MIASLSVDYYDTVNDEFDDLSSLSDSESYYQGTQATREHGSGAHAAICHGVLIPLNMTKAERVHALKGLRCRA